MCKVAMLKECRGISVKDAADSIPGVKEGGSLWPVKLLAVTLYTGGL